MALPSSGPISLSDVNVELGLSATAQISLNDSVVRTLFAVGSGAIGMADGRGKANQFAFTISSNQTNANLATLATNAGWNGQVKVIATIGSGIYISSNSTGTPALTVNGSFPTGVELINNGFIVGMGGNGGNGGYGNPGDHASGTYPSSGAGGGLALSVSSAITITNNGTIGGGGGGGGGAQGRYLSFNYYGQAIAVGGGGGGGRTGTTNSSGGYGGNYGSAGTTAGGGAGGAGNQVYGGGMYAVGGTGGSGGTWGSGGGYGGSGYGSQGGYYSWSTGRYGGGGGAAISGNSNITWVSTGTRLGAIS